MNLSCPIRIISDDGRHRRRFDFGFQKKVEEDGRLVPEFAADDEERVIISGTDVDLILDFERKLKKMEGRLLPEFADNEEQFIKEKKGRVWRFTRSPDARTGL